MRTLILLCASTTLLLASDCTRTSTGLPPLTAPFSPSYKGSRLGLYPNGSNTRPTAFEARGRAQAADVRPRDTAGAIDDSGGRIALLSIGMSNTTQEFSAFQQLAARDRTINPRVALVDGAQGGWTAARILGNPATYFATVDQRMAAARVSNPQVQAAWIKLADAQPTASFPDHVNLLLNETKQILGLLRARYPNLRLVYLSSRIYAGYASTPLNPEPFAYESAFAVKWLVEQQISGDASLPAVPWLSWGPYLWADGTKMRSDGLAWSCADFADDGTHPGNAGRAKVAQMLLDFFKTDTTTRPWFVGGTAPPARAPVAAEIVNAASFAPPITIGSLATIMGSELAPAETFADSVPLPYGLAGVRVTVGGAPAPIYGVSPTRIHVVVPTDGESAAVIVSREGVESKPISAQFTLQTIGLFSLDRSGKGAAAARHADGRMIDSQHPAHLSETIELYATGHGIRNPLILAPEFLPGLRVGGIPADLAYYGPAPGAPGLDQLNITIPANTPLGDAVSIEVQMGTLSANTVTLAISQ